VTDNIMENIGYVGMVVERNALVERNVVRHVLAILNDGGGIAFDNADGMIIRDNIVMDISGNLESSAPNFSNYEPICHGIYFGNISIRNTLVQHNTVANCDGSGIHVDHTMVSSGNRIEDNVLFNNTIQLSISDFSNYNGPGATAPFHVPAFNDVYSGNILYSLTADQLCMRQYHVYSANWVDYGTFTGNYYFNPYNDRSILQHNTHAGVTKYFSLERWQAERGEDASSLSSPKHMDAYEVLNVLGASQVPNGNFAYDVAGWSGWPSQGQLTHDYALLDNGALKVHFANNATYNEFTLKHTQLAAVQSGLWYRLRFSIQSTMHGEVKAGFKGLTQQPGSQMVASRYSPFSPVRRDVTLFFQSDLTDQGNCTCTNRHLESTYWLDNVELKRVSVAPLDPFERQVLLVNEEAVPVTVPLAGCWSDVLGEIYSVEVEVPAYGSKVLVKEEDDLCTIHTAVEDAAVGATIGVHPNPVEAGGALRLAIDGMVADVTLCDLNGRIVERMQEVRNGTVGVPQALAAGVYVLSCTDERGDRRSTRVVVR